MADSVEQGSSFQGDMAAPGPALPSQPLLLLLRHRQPNPGQSNHSLCWSRKIQRVLVLHFYFWKGLAPTPLLHCEPCWTTRSTVRTKFTFIVYGDTMA